MKIHLRKPEGRTSFPSFVNSGPLRVVGCETATTTIPTRAAITTITLTVMLHLSSGRTRVLLVSVLHTVGQCRKITSRRADQGESIGCVEYASSRVSSKCH